MSLKGLGKPEREVTAKDVQAEHFIKGAKPRVAALTPSNAKFERCMFSLTAEVSAEIERLSLVPREFRASRSDVVKAAVAAFTELSEAEQIKWLMQVK